MPEFLELFHKLVAKHQNALRGRWEKFWASEATSIQSTATESGELVNGGASRTYLLC